MKWKELFMCHILSFKLLVVIENKPTNAVWIWFLNSHITCKIQKFSTYLSRSLFFHPNCIFNSKHTLLDIIFIGAFFPFSGIIELKKISIYKLLCWKEESKKAFIKDNRKSVWRTWDYNTFLQIPFHWPSHPESYP